MSAEATIKRPGRRMNAGSWLVLALAIGYLVAGLVYTLLAFQQPTDGWFYEPSDNVTVEFSQGGAGPLRPGDRVIAVAGRALDEDSDFVRRGPPPNWELGATVPYTVVRDGTTIELEVPLVRRQPSALLRSLLAESVVGNFALLFCLALGFVVFFLRPRDIAARLLLLILVYYMDTTWADSPVMQAFYPPMLVALAFARIGLWPLLWVMVTHLILSFPVRKLDGARAGRPLRGRTTRRVDRSAAAVRDACCQLAL